MESLIWPGVVSGFDGFPALSSEDEKKPFRPSSLMNGLSEFSPIESGDPFPFFPGLIGIREYEFRSF